MMLTVSLFFFFYVDVFASNITRSCDEDPSSNICLLQKLKTLEQILKTSQSEVRTFQKAFETLQAQDINCPILSFSSQLTNDVHNPSIGFHLVYKDVKLNIGNGYNNHHGAFVAPISGIYFLSYRFGISPGNCGSFIRLVMEINGELVSYVMSAYETHYITGSSTSINHLNAGDDVWLEVLDNNNHFVIYGNRATPVPRSVFEGFFITC